MKVKLVMGSVVGKLESPNECVPETKLEAKMVEAIRQGPLKEASSGLLIP